MELNKIKDFQLSGDDSQTVMRAGQLGLVAQIDPPLALKWAKSASSQIVSVWAQLNIAAAMSRNDKPAARQLIKNCYQELSNCDRSDQVLSNYAYPPSVVGAAGLRLVEIVDPELLRESIECVVECVISPQQSKLNNATDNVFWTITGIAR